MPSVSVLLICCGCLYLLLDNTLDYLVLFIVGFQQIISVGRSVSAYFNSDVRRIYTFLKILCFDYEVR